MPLPQDVRQVHIGDALIEVKDALNRVSSRVSSANLTLGDRYLADEELHAVWEQVVDITNKNRAAIDRVEREQRRWTAKKLAP